MVTSIYSTLVIPGTNKIYWIQNLHQVRRQC